MTKSVKVFYFYILGKSIGGRGHKISDYFEVSLSTDISSS